MPKYDTKIAIFVRLEQMKCTLHRFCFELSHNRDMATVVLIELSYINTGKLMKGAVQKRVINDIPTENFRPQNAENCRGCRVKDTPFLRLEHYIG